MLQEYRHQVRLMGSAFMFAIITDKGKRVAEQLIDEGVREVQRIENLLTEFSPDSETARINHNAGGNPISVSEEVYQLILRSCDISRLTKGAFDITAGGLKNCYSFPNGSGQFPADAVLKKALSTTGYENIRLSPPDQVLLNQAGMRIGFGGIGKGYAADRVRVMLQEMGVEHGVVDASGDLSVWGHRANRQPWKIGVAHPDNPEQIILWMPVNGTVCMATSGNYENYFEHNGIRYGHTIDPRTGKPALGVKSVTVFSPSAELSDALATAVTVLGIREGLALLDELPGTHGMIVDVQNQIHFSKKINLNAEALG